MKIEINDLKDFANKYKLTHVIVFGYDGVEQHVATYGDTLEQCSQAADFGNLLKDSLGWPKSLHAQPSRVQELQKRIDELNSRILELTKVPEFKK